MTQLSDTFSARVWTAIEECRSLGYNPSDFVGMLERSNAVSLAERLVTSGDIQSGLKRLVGLGRPELSIEAIMLEPEFNSLFKQQVLAAAQWRLDRASTG